MPGTAEPGASPEPKRCLAALVLAALFGFGAGDALRLPQHQALARLAIGAIDAYRSTVSPALSRTGFARCLYQPSCSAYSREAIRRYGFPRSGWLAARRVLRCNPWSKGGNDPVP